MRRSLLPIAVLMTWVLGACAAGVAADPSSTAHPTTSAVTSTPDPAADDSLAQVVQRYGDAHPDEFAGVYYDQEHGGRLVARFTGHVDVHQHALDVLLGSRGRVFVIDAASSQTSLQAIVDAITGNHQGLADQGIELQTASVDVISNKIQLQAKGDNPQAERILQAYGPPGVVVVDLYPADKPWTPRCRRSRHRSSPTATARHRAGSRASRSRRGPEGPGRSPRPRPGCDPA